MDLNFAGKRVFISASSEGIGKATAYSFLKEGAVVAINGRSREKLKKTYKEFAREFGDDRVIYLEGDMADETQIESLVSELKKEFGRLDVLVCNLGSGKGLGDNRYDWNEWERLYNINLFSTVKIIDECINLMQENTGSIICLSSLVSFDKIGAPPAYAAAKAGINSLVKYLADDMAVKGIRVNGVAPGNVYYEGGRWQELSNIDPEGTKKYIEMNVPMKRFGKPEEIADAVLFLASERASFITGTILKVDGGQGRGY